MAFKPFEPKIVKSPKLVLKLEIELLQSSYTAEEAAEKLEQELNNSYCKAFSEFIVLLLQETKSSMWEMRKLEIENDETPNI